METATYTGSRRAYLRPATHITDIQPETLICQQSPSSVENGGDDGGNGTSESRRRSIFGESEEKGIW